MGRMSWGSPYTKQTIGNVKRPKKQKNRVGVGDYLAQNLVNYAFDPTQPDNGQWLYQRPADANRAYVAPPTLRVRTVAPIEPPETTEQPNQTTQGDIIERRIHIRPWWRVIADDEETDIDRWVDNIAETIAESDYATVTAYLLGTNNDTYFIECCDIYGETFGHMVELIEASVELYREDRDQEQVEIERQDNEEDYEPDEADEPVF